MSSSRRQFLKTSVAASAAATLGGLKLSAGQASTPSARDYFELRAYRLKTGASPAVLDKYLEKALIPAANKSGVSAVGVFTEMEPKADEQPTVWVLMPHTSLESVAKVTASLSADPALQQAAAEYFSAATKDHPSFDRIDSWLHLAFAGQPHLEVPALKRAGKPRVFEMRTYESYSETKALNKVEMFNAGEIDVMREVGLSPVFYGQALTGRDLPHLTYMLCSADRDAHKTNWTAFTKHATWNKLKVDPRYQDNVTKITSRFLVPAAFSQI